MLDVRSAAVGVLAGKVDRATLETEDHDYVPDGVADIPAVLEKH